MNNDIAKVLLMALRVGVTVDEIKKQIDSVLPDILIPGRCEDCRYKQTNMLGDMAPGLQRCGLSKKGISNSDFCSQYEKSKAQGNCINCKNCERQIRSSAGMIDRMIYSCTITDMATMASLTGQCGAFELQEEQDNGN